MIKEFSKSKSMELPREVTIGHDALIEIPGTCDNLKLSGAGVIVADEMTKKIAGDRIQQILTEKGFDMHLHVIKDASTEVVAEVKALLQETKSNFAIGVGGGRPIDIAKCSSYDAGVPFISFPTVASHDGIVSSRASIKENGLSISIQAKPPLAVVADTGIIAKSPHRFLAAGCADVISNLTAVRDWQLAHRLKNEEYSSSAAILSKMSAAMIMENAEVMKPGHEKSAWIVMKTLVSSGVAMSIAGSSRPASGSEHKFSHALDRVAPGKALHGEQCGIGSIMMMYLHGGDWQNIRETMRMIGAPVDARGMGVSREDVLKALVLANEIRPERYTILGDSNLTEEAAEHLATVTKVI